MFFLSLNNGFLIMNSVFLYDICAISLMCMYLLSYYYIC